MTRAPSAVELLAQGTGLLTRTHSRELGLQRGAVDAVFRALDVVRLPGYSRPLIRVEDYLRLIEDCTFGDDVVHPIGDLADKHPRLRRRRLGH